jgi:hypothetical protein
MKRATLWFSAAAVVAGALLLRSAAAEQKPGLSQFMRPKLTHSQRLLEGLSLENYELIAREARALRTLSETADWQVLPSIEYVRYSADFQRLCNEMIRHANGKNLDGASLAYLQLTLNCIECHKHVRQYRDKEVKRP